MFDAHIAVVPVGKVSTDEVRAALERAVKFLRQPVELRAPIPVPPGVEDTARRQHRAAELLQALRGQSFRTGAGELVGAEGRPSRKPDLWLFVTDVDLFTAQTDGTIAALSRRTGVAIVSIRRLREAFYRRPADPNRQRARLVKELLRMIGRLAGLKECPTPTCALAGTRGVPDIDVKQEMFCRPCAQAFFQGRISI